MSVERLLQISTATLASLGTLLLGMGQRDERLPILVLLAAIASVWLTDVTGWFRLNRIVASVVAVVASLVAFHEAVPLDSVVSVLAIAQLLVYLQIVLLFQHKETRTYWQLLVLSLLQVVVAAVFNQGAAFGLLMVVYLFVALATMTLLFLYREAEHYRAQAEPARHDVPTGRRWSLAAQQPVFTGDARAKRLQRPTAGRDLFGRVAKMGLGTLALTAVAFFILPRFGQPAWRSMIVPARQMVGYSGEVRLGELGQVIESPEEVMRVELIDEATGRVHPVDDAIYLHGTILTQYCNRRWSVPEDAPPPAPPRRRGPRHWPEGWGRRPPNGDDRRPGLNGEDYRDDPFGERDPEQPPRGGDPREGESPRRESPERDGRRGRRDFWAENYLPLEPVAAPPVGNVVDEKITIEPMNRPELFAVRPYFVTDAHPELHVDPKRDRLLRERNLCRSRYAFTLKTTAFRRGRQATLVPCSARPDGDELLQVPNDEVPSLVNLARRWMAEPGLSADRRIDRVKHLERRLRDSGQFTYSLKPQQRDYHIDPIEDFITNHPQGHCEYFATTLTLMLRSQGIPARMVIGYKCDEYNPLGNFFQVRQLHAHTWVEAFLEPEQLSDDPADPQWRNGGWLRLDPTPGSDDDPGAVETALAPVGRGLDWFDSIWNNYVMEMDRSRQRRAIYQPVVRWCKDTWRRLADPEWWREVWQKALWAVNPRHWNVGQWFSWRGGLVAMAVSLLLVLLFRAARSLLGAVRRRLRPEETAGEAADRVELEFYRRLRTLLARYGLRRRTGQTQREFAQLAGVQLAERLGDPCLAPLPGEITAAFYQVRFGRLPLDNPRHQAVEQALAQLDKAHERKPVP
ncbi:MAG: DUF3488 and transglutaminase-like domain-containing protein [Planctomycetia bacterium]|nr:DUF3488 and transglutaminase-like domain-containing protein [Planctomycetia bacterium]